MKKRIATLIVCILLLILTFITITYFTDKDKVRIMSYDLDASDSIHYQLNEDIEIEDSLFKIASYEEIVTGEWKLEFIEKEPAWQTLHDGYTFKLAYDDKVLIDSNCMYEADTIIILDLTEQKAQVFNQFVIVNNRDHEVIATIALE